jgi:hypothetical protein
LSDSGLGWAGLVWINVSPNAPASAAMKMMFKAKATLKVNTATRRSLFCVKFRLFQKTPKV